MSIAAITIPALLAGCAKDRTVDDFNHEQVQQYLAQMQSVAGTYRGAVTSKKDQSTLAGGAATVGPDASVSTGGSSLETIQQASLQGTFSLTDASGEIRQISFKHGAYDSTNGDFRASTMIQVTSTLQQEIDISGNISNGTMTGEITSAGYPEFGGSFAFTLNGEMPSAQALADSRSSAGPADGVARLYSGIANEATGQTVRYNFSIIDSQSTVEQRFLDVFQPVKFVNISVRNCKHPQAAVLITNAQWDLRTGDLSGEGISTTATASYDVVLKCKAVGESFRCQYIDHLIGGELFTAVFAPQSRPITSCDR